MSFLDEVDDFNLLRRLPHSYLAELRNSLWWSRNVALLPRAKQEELILGIAHSHPGGPNRFSEQDDVNEAELFRTMCHRNGPKSKFVSVLFAGDDKVLARVWQHPKHQTDVRMITFIGERIQVHRPGTASLGAPAFARQALAFGPELTSQLKSLRFGVIGAGGTGSATAPLLARAGAGQIVIIDDDIVETTNLNRLHGATQSDADAMRPKAEVVAAEIARMGLGTRVIPMRGWVSDPAVRDALKSCDVIFCCTDDHAGRVFLNRLAYFYLTVVFDMGLAMAVAPPPGEQHGRYLSTRNNFNAAGGLSALPGRSRSRDRARRGFASERSR